MAFECSSDPPCLFGCALVDSFFQPTFVRTMCTSSYSSFSFDSVIGFRPGRVSYHSSGPSRRIAAKGRIKAIESPRVFS